MTPGDGIPAPAAEGKEIARRALVTTALLILGYIGVYLCRKNLSIATVLLNDAGHSMEALGAVASWGTVAYAAGKFASGPVIDRIGGRAGFLLALGGVALFGALGGLTSGLAGLTLFYGLNRFFGAWGWNGMVKTASTWYPPGRLATAIAALSASYVLGGIAGPVLAGEIAERTGDWRVVMGLPSLVLLGILVACAAGVRQGPVRLERSDGLGAVRDDRGAAGGPNRAGPPRSRPVSPIVLLLSRPQFLLLCALSFALTLLREAMSNWSPAFLKSLGGDLRLAALQSTGFEIAGLASILGMGLLYDRLRPDARRWLIVGILALLTAMLLLLGSPVSRNAAAATLLIAAVGLLSYAPYSVLGGVVAVEVGGTDLAATASGFVDGVGYLAAILAGWWMGGVLDRTGFGPAFLMLSGLTLASSLLAIGIRTRPAAVTAGAGG